MLRKKKYYKSGFMFIRTELNERYSSENPYCEECINYKAIKWSKWSYKRCLVLDSSIKEICIRLTPKGYLGKTRYIVKERKDRKYN